MRAKLKKSNRGRPGILVSPPQLCEYMAEARDARWTQLLSDLAVKINALTVPEAKQGKTCVHIPWHCLGDWTSETELRERVVMRLKHLGFITDFGYGDITDDTFTLKWTQEN